MCDLKIFSNQQMIAERPGPSWVPRKKHTFQKPSRDKEGENGSKKKKKVNQIIWVGGVHWMSVLKHQIHLISNFETNREIA